ncbi:MAG: glycine cleavage system aminomethyltransferase GcvT [Bacillota bacterium]
MEQTPLNKIHKKMGAKMINFYGWEMPLQYSSIIEEHKAVRNNCGLFDVSHMGEILIKGEEASINVQKLITNNINKIENGKALYTPMCREDGGIIDDLLVFQLNQKMYLLVVNASNIEKDFNWITQNINGSCKVENISNDFALIAVQGPESENILAELFFSDIKSLKSFQFIKTKFENKEILISKTGYTGETGFELFSPPDKIEKIWNMIMTKKEKYNILPTGLGARNTLRLEKKLCLYGNDITEDNHPFEAGLGWTVDLTKEFKGKESLIKIKEKGFDNILSGFIMKERGIPRKDYLIQKGGQNVGRVTSGSYSPSLDENIGIGYLNKKYSSPGTEINIIIRDKKYKAEVVEMPFV